MRFQISLSAIEGKTLPLNYAYPLSAAIYKIIQTADVDYAAFLHNAGYGNGLYIGGMGCLSRSDVERG